MKPLDDLDKLRSWLVEDTGSEAAADHLMNVAERLSKLPDLISDPTAEKNLSHRLLEDHFGHHAQRTLVWIEDDPSMLDLGALILRAKDFKILGSVSGVEGLELVSRVKPDLVLLDIMIPDMDGWEIFQRMRSNAAMANIPVIMVTAKAQPIDRLLASKIAKVDDYVVKPFSPGELIGSIDRVLAASGKNVDAPSRV